MIAAPPYPDHPSGLASVGCSAMESLRYFYGRDDATFSGTTLPTAAAPNGVTRTFNSFSQMCEDIVDARVWSGIHFRFADTAGRKQAQRVADWTFNHYLLPLRH